MSFGSGLFRLIQYPIDRRHLHSAVLLACLEMSTILLQNMNYYFPIDKSFAAIYQMRTTTAGSWF